MKTRTRLSRSTHYIIVYIAAVFVTGCITTTPSLQEWVNDRGYTYYPNYSSINILGYVGDGNLLLRNTDFFVQGERGSLPRLEKETSRKFEVKGSADISGFLARAISSAKIEGDFSKAYKASVVLQDPFMLQARTFIPLSTCRGSKMVAIAVLNTGDMSIQIENANNLNITSTFKVETTRDVSGGVTVQGGNTLKITGSNLYVGYLPRQINCSVVATKNITLSKDEDSVDPETGLFARYVSYRESGGLGEALVYMRVSGSAGFHESAKKAAEYAEKVFVFDDISAKISKKTLLLADRERQSIVPKLAIIDPWTDAQMPQNPSDANVPVGSLPIKYRLTALSSLGLAGKDRETGLEMEVLKLSKTQLTLQISLIRYSEVK